MIATLAACGTKMSPEEAKAAEREATRLAARAALQLQHEIAMRFDICLNEAAAEGMSQPSAVTFCSHLECMNYRRDAERLRELKAYARRLPANSKSGLMPIGEALHAAGVDISIDREQAKLENSMMAYAQYCNAAGI